MGRNSIPAAGRRRATPPANEGRPAPAPPSKPAGESVSGSAEAARRDSMHRPGEPSAGLDQARHAAAQRASYQAEALRDGVFPALLAAAVGLDRHFETAAYRVYLARVLKDLGDPADPIERMLVEQLCLAHFRTAQLHVGAGQAQGLEATKLYNAVAARMLGEMRRTALALKAYRTGVPAGQPRGATLKLFKAAQ